MRYRELIESEESIIVYSRGNVTRKTPSPFTVMDSVLNNVVHMCSPGSKDRIDVWEIRPRKIIKFDFTNPDFMELLNKAGLDKNTSPGSLVSGESAREPFREFSLRDGYDVLNWNETRYFVFDTSRCRFIKQLYWDGRPKQQNDALFENVADHLFYSQCSVATADTIPGRMYSRYSVARTCLDVVGGERRWIREWKIRPSKPLDLRKNEIQIHVSQLIDELNLDLEKVQYLKTLRFWRFAFRPIGDDMTNFFRSYCIPNELCADETIMSWIIRAGFDCIYFNDGIESIFLIDKTRATLVQELDCQGRAEKKKSDGALFETSEVPAKQFMDDLMASGRPSYSDPEDVVIESTSVKCRIYGPREILLNSIMVTSYNRERGEGSRVLKIICDLADRHGVTIYGNAYPIRRMLSDRILKLPDLIAWYERHGFVVSKEPAERGVNMTRKPIGKQKVKRDL